MILYHVNSCKHSPKKQAGSMSRILRQRIHATLADDPPRSKSLLVTVFGDSITPHGGR
jgi:hypothetical protein